MSDSIAGKKSLHSRIPTFTTPSKLPIKSPNGSPAITPTQTTYTSPVVSPTPSPRPQGPAVHSALKDKLITDVASPSSSISSFRITTPVRDSSDKDICSITVAVRLRPLSEREITRGDREVWGIDEDGNIGTLNNGRVNARFAYDLVFPPDMGNEEVYQNIGHTIIAPTMSGINGTLFAYGVTSSGKTHTIMGTSEDPGVVPRAILDVFALIENSPQKSFLIRLSMLEIYNEVINDLLDPSRTNLRLREDPSRQVMVEGLMEEVVLNAQHALHLISSGESNRKVSATAYNDGSSRSHTICRLAIESCDRSAALAGGRAARTLSHLHIIDLAGSESAKAATTKGHRMEGSFINKSLLTLGTVIHKLAEGNSPHIPFRDSKLTRLLQPSLSGTGAKVAIVCNITPAGAQMEETSNTLKFASRAKLIKIAVSRNEIIDEKSLIKKYQREIAELKEQLATAAIAGPTQAVLTTVPHPLDEYLAEENETLKSKLKEATAKAAKETTTLETRICRLTRMILKSTAAVHPAMRGSGGRLPRSRSADLTTSASCTSDSPSPTPDSPSYPAGSPTSARRMRYSTATGADSYSNHAIALATGPAVKHSGSAPSLRNEADAQESADGLNLRNPAWSSWKHDDDPPRPSSAGAVSIRGRERIVTTSGQSMAGDLACSPVMGGVMYPDGGESDLEKELLREQLAVLVEELGESYRRVEELRKHAVDNGGLASGSSYGSDHDVEIQVLYADREMLQDRLCATENESERLQASLEAATRQLEELKSDNERLLDRNRGLESEAAVRAAASPPLSPMRTRTAAGLVSELSLAANTAVDTSGAPVAHEIASSTSLLSQLSVNKLDDNVLLARLGVMEAQVESALAEIARRDEQLARLKALEARAAQLAAQNSELQRQLAASQAAAAEGQKMAVENQMMSGEVGRLRLATNRLQGYMLDNMSADELSTLIATLTQAVERVRITVQTRRAQGQHLPLHTAPAARSIPSAPAKQPTPQPGPQPAAQHNA